MIFYGIAIIILSFSSWLLCVWWPPYFSIHYPWPSLPQHVMDPVPVVIGNYHVWKTKQQVAIMWCPVIAWPGRTEAKDGKKRWDAKKICGQGSGLCTWQNIIDVICNKIKAELVLWLIAINYTLARSEPHCLMVPRTHANLPSPPCLFPQLLLSETSQWH